MSFAIRPYHPTDLYSLYEICLKTGYGGEDATDRYRDPQLLGHLYAAPYAVFEPDLCFVLTHADAPVGYILGTRDSPSFSERCESDWFPMLRRRYPLPPAEDRSPDAGIIRSIHQGHSVDPEFADYPAHLHIDLLPIGQGQGWGRRMMQTFLDQLRALGVMGVHLGVGIHNQRAILFYERLGFHRVLVGTSWIGFGLKL
jgi:ribosomal protein S18 acetylase RimI-like enzyme